MGWVFLILGTILFFGVVIYLLMTEDEQMCVPCVTCKWSTYIYGYYTCHCPYDNDTVYKIELVCNLDGNMPDCIFYEEEIDHV